MTHWKVQTIDAEVTKSFGASLLAIVLMLVRLLQFEQASEVVHYELILLILKLVCILWNSLILVLILKLYKLYFISSFWPSHTPARRSGWLEMSVK